MAERGCTWSVREISSLISIWAEDFMKETIAKKSAKGQRNAYIYMEVAKRMEMLGYSRTPEQCRRKVKKLKEEYYKAIQESKKHGEERVKYRFYDQLVPILGNCTSGQPMDLRHSDDNDTGHGSGNETGECSKRKWRNLRDLHVKRRGEIRTNKIGRPVQRAQNWKFLDDMAFLDCFTEDGRTDSNVSAVDYESGASSCVYGDQEVNNPEGRSSIVSPSSKPPNSTDALGCSFGSPEVSNAIRPQKRQNENRPDHGVLKSSSMDLNKGHKKFREDHEGKSGSQTVPKTAEDAFFESCALRMKKLSPVTKSYVLLQISQIFFNAENHDLPQIPIMPLPPKETCQAKLDQDPKNKKTC